MLLVGAESVEELNRMLDQPLTPQDLEDLSHMVPPDLSGDPDELEEQEEGGLEGLEMKDHSESGTDVIPQETVQFSVELKELRTRIKPFATGKSRDGPSKTDYVDLAVGHGELALTTTGFSTVLPVEVKSPGYARVPYPLFEVVIRKPEALGEKSIAFEIQPGKMKAGPLRFNNPGITLQSLGTRLTDLPLGASLADTLELSLRFSHDDLLSSGLWDTVAAAQERAKGLVEKAVEILEPLEITRDDVNRLVWDRIKHRSESRGPT